MLSKKLRMHGIPRIDLNVEDILTLECIDVKCC